MGTIGAVAGVVAIIGGLIKDSIDDPKKRARAIVEVVDKLKELRERLYETNDIEELDRAVLALIATIHDL